MFIRTEASSSFRDSSGEHFATLATTLGGMVVLLESTPRNGGERVLFEAWHLGAPTGPVQAGNLSAIIADGEGAWSLEDGRVQVLEMPEGDFACVDGIWFTVAARTVENGR